MSQSGANILARLAYSVAETCYIVPCGKTKLYELIGEGLLDARSLGGRTIITAESIMRLIASLPTAPIGATKHRGPVEAAETVDVGRKYGGATKAPLGRRAPTEQHAE
jgi:hypothetical protein